MNTPNHPATLRESIAAEIEWHRAEEAEWREEEKLCPGDERPQCRIAAMEHKTAADRLEARLASHPEDGRGEPALVWRAHGQDRWNFTNPYPLDKLGEPNRELYEFHWVHALPDVDKHEAGLLESEGGEGRGEELELERAFANGEAVQPSYLLGVVGSLAERAEADEARAIKAEEALGRVKEWASEATPGVHPEAWLKGVGDAKWVVLSLLPSNDALPLSKDHSERSGGEGGGGKAATDEVCQSASSSGPGTAASLTSCPTCGSGDPKVCMKFTGPNGWTPHAWRPGGERR